MAAQFPSIERLSRLYLACAPGILMLLCRRFRFPNEVAEDALQTVFLRAAEGVKAGRKLGFLDDEDAAGAARYFSRAALNECLNQARFKKYQSQKEAALLAAISPERTILDKEINEEAVTRLNEAISELGAPYREIFSYLINENLPLIEVARRLEIKEGSIYTQYQRGIEKLRKVLNAEK